MERARDSGAWVVAVHGASESPVGAVGAVHAAGSPQESLQCRTAQQDGVNIDII